MSFHPHKQDMKAVVILVLAALLPVLGLPQWHKVIHRISHSSIRLPTSFHQPPKEVTWKHKTAENVIQTAKIQNGLMADRLNSRYTVGNNGRALCIHNVTEYDNGEYIAEATLENYTIVNETFYLMVHEPVPQPRITSELRRIGDQCNITLHCSVPSKASDLSYSWKYNQSADVAGSTITITFPLDKDIEIVCVAHNPADQKNVSIRVEQCSEKTRSHVPAIISVIMVAAFSVMVWMYLRKSGQDITENENLKSSIQDTESTFNNIPRGKTYMKTEEEYVEVSKLEDEPKLLHQQSTTP